MNTGTLTPARPVSPTATPTRGRRPLRRRFALTSAGLLSVLVAVLGVNFAGDTGTSSPAITNKSGIAITAGSPQQWDVSVGAAGSVPAPGAAKIATIDPTNATSTKMLVSVYITNLDDLALNYSSWNFNLGLDDGTATVGTDQVMTSDSGTVSWVVTIAPATTYNLRLEEGGSFYTIGNGSSGSLSPQFFVRATQL